MNQLLCSILSLFLLAGLARLVGVNVFKFQIFRKLGLAALALFLVGAVLPSLLQGLASVPSGLFLIGWLILSVPAYYIRRALQPHKAPAQQSLQGAERTPLPAQHIHSAGEGDW